MIIRFFHKPRRLKRHIANRTIRKRYYKNALNKKIDHMNRITPFGYKPTAKDKQLAVTGFFNGKVPEQRFWMHN